MTIVYALCCLLLHFIVVFEDLQPSSWDVEGPPELPV